MEKKIHSQEILKTIGKNIKIFSASFLILSAAATIKISNMPVQYKAQAFFRYMGMEPMEVTIKEDNNGTITLKSFRAGEDNLDIATLLKGEEFKKIKGEGEVTLRFDNGNGNYILEGRGNTPEIIADVNNSLKFIQDKNREFLERKISGERDIETRAKIESELENPDRSFPIIVEAYESEQVDNKKGTLLLFSLMIISLLSILMAFISEEIKEVRRER